MLLGNFAFASSSVTTESNPPKNSFAKYPPSVNSIQTLSFAALPVVCEEGMFKIVPTGPKFHGNCVKNPFLVILTFVDP